MENQKTLERLAKYYKLIPMSDITDEARVIAVRWCENYRPSGSIDLSNKHKLASDIMNYATMHTKEFVEWLHENTEIIKEEKITLFRHYSKELQEYANFTLDDIYDVYIEWLKEDS